ncbi:hypothetical protein [Nocardia sp. NPDC058705]|uniref:hypothetical protein n=1 Tax=Nocardia sp. NPDC058705 TaxID=3346609 RepID=UPI003677ED42
MTGPQRRDNAELARVVLMEAVLGTAVAAGVDARAARVAEERATEERRQQQGRGATRGRREADHGAIGLTVFVCITILGPYLLGHFVIRRTLLLQPDSRVYEEQARGITDHWWADYFGGVTAILALLALFLLVRPWAFRRTEVGTGWAVAIFTLVVLVPLTIAQWHDAEEKTVTSLREGSFPHADRYLNCASYTFLAKDESGRPETWQVHLGSTKGTHPRNCNRADIYRGWRFTSAYDLGNGDEFTEEIEATSTDWNNAVTAPSSTVISQRKNGRIDPANLTVHLTTEADRRLVFTLTGGANGQFELR